MTLPPDGAPAGPSAGHVTAQTDPRTSSQPEAAADRTLVVRSAPRVQVFLIGGGVLGVLAAFIVSVAGEANPEFTLGSVFGYFLVIFGVAGIGLGGLVWLVLDRRSRKGTYRVTAQEVQDPEEADYALSTEDLRQHAERGAQPSSEDSDHDAR